MATRIILFSDVHANIHALEAVVQDSKRYAADAMYCLGDIVSGCAFPNECIDYVRSHNIPCVRGNHDEDVATFFFANRKASATDTLTTRAKLWTASIVGRERASYLRDLPFSIVLELEQIKLRLVHGSPRKNTEGIFPHTGKERLREIACSSKFRVLCSGHTHYPFIGRYKKRWFVNSGTAGRPKMKSPLVNYVVLTMRSGEVEAVFPRVAYDVDRAAEGILHSGLPDFFAEVVRLGIPVPRK